MNNKVFIGLITGNEKQNIQEIVDNLGEIDGILAVDHYSTDGTYELLEQNKRDGDIIRCPYQNNHSQSMNIWLNSPKLNIGDWVILLDSSERIGPKLLANLKSYLLWFEQSNINTIVNHSKVFIFRRWPQMFFNSTPHWSLQNSRQGYLKLEDSGLFEKEEDYYFSVRNIGRDKFHWLTHYVKYFLQKDSNHLLLGLEGKPNFVETFTKRENQRIEFLLYLKERNLPNIISSIDFLCREEPLDQKFREFANSNKILNDYFAYNILGKTDLVDNHNWEEIIKV